VLGQLGQHEETAAAYCEPLRMDPDSAAAHNILSEALTCLGGSRTPDLWRWRDGAQRLDDDIQADIARPSPGFRSRLVRKVGSRQENPRRG
jgi:hypothetical protein